VPEIITGESTSKGGGVYTTERGKRLQAFSIDWAWPFSNPEKPEKCLLREIPGFSVRRRRTNATAMFTMLCSRADTPWTPMATQSTSTKELRTVRLLWLWPAFGLYSSGRQRKFRTPPASAGVMKLVLAVFQFIFGSRHRHLSRVFTIKTTHVPRLLRLWTVIRLAGPACTMTARCFSGCPFGDESSPCTLKALDPVPAPQP
jgi:hypothetical protein